MTQQKDTQTSIHCRQIALDVKCWQSCHVSTYRSPRVLRAGTSAARPGRRAPRQEGFGGEEALTHPCSRRWLEPREPEPRGQVLAGPGLHPCAEGSCCARGGEGARGGEAGAEADAAGSSWPSSSRSQRSCVASAARGSPDSLRAAPPANAAREGSAARLPRRRSLAEPPGPRAPGCERASEDGRARGGPRAGRSCRPPRVPGPPAARGRGRGAAVRAPSTRPGLLGRRAAGFPPTTEPVQTSHRSLSSNRRRRLFLPSAGFGGPPEVGSGRGSAGQGPGTGGRRNAREQRVLPARRRQPRGSGPAAAPPPSGRPRPVPPARAPGPCRRRGAAASELCPRPSRAPPLPPQPQRSR